MDIQVIDAKPEHVEGIQEVIYRVWLDTYPNAGSGVTVEDVEDRFKSRLSEKILEKRKQQIMHLDSTEKFLVALDGAKVVGLCRATKGDKEHRLTAIYVLPEYQRKGIGTALWNKVKDFFVPPGDILVGVATYNQGAIDFYSKLGFKDTGRRYTEERHRMQSGAILPQMDMRLSR